MEKDASPPDIWREITACLEKELPPSGFDAWIRPVHAALETQAGKPALVLRAPSRFFLDGLKDSHETRIRELLRERKPDLALRFEVDPDLAARALAATTDNGKDERRNRVDGHIDPRFTFANFVVGASNEFCHAACRAVAEKPGEAYNPLYIYGGVGLGKTHLINAVANELLTRDGFHIAYRTGETFTNELIKAIRDGATEAFRNRYRKADVLIIDDIQFIAGKDRTQEEFFHTFNALHEVNKQIILTSDRSPRELTNLMERLRSRFNWGLVADIQPPDLETRLAILESKAELAGIRLDPDVAQLLANRITNNVRELEGALTRLTAHANLTRKRIDLDYARHVLRDLLKEEKRAISVEDIQKKVAAYFNINVREMRSSKRSRTIAFPRQIAMYLAKELTALSLPEIGQEFGGKDHTTVLYAVRKIEKLKREDAGFADELERLTAIVRP